MATSKLTRYREMRDFTRTSEPAGEGIGSTPAEALRFVIQKHAASHLHFDLRLEFDGTFRSWAVPKGPSLDPRDRRLAMEVEDHPLDYGDFEGTIPQGEYGGGTVMLWDRGLWAPLQGFEDIGAALTTGELKFVLEGERMHGSWVLVRTKRDARGKAAWMLIKHRDEAAQPGNPAGPGDADRSVASGRSMAEIAAGKGKAPTPFMTQRPKSAASVWHSRPAGSPPAPAAAPAKPKAKAKARPKARARTKAAPRPATASQPAALPNFIEPQLARSVEKPPAGPGWAHEIKFDGYRMQLRSCDGKATLLTRSALDWSDRFPALIAAGASLPDGIMDGEVVALDHTGAPSFAALQAALADAATDNLVFFAFDLLFDGTEDLRDLPLAERKARLKRRLAAATRPGAELLRHVEHFENTGDTVLQSACRMDLEGIVSKRLDAPYQSGRGESWTKAKCRGGHEVVIGAYTTTAGHFRSLIAGINKGGELVHVGRIGTGFGRETVERLLPRLRALETAESPFSGKGAPHGSASVHWLKPELVAEDSDEEDEGAAPGSKRAKKDLDEKFPVALDELHDVFDESRDGSVEVLPHDKGQEDGRSEDRQQHHEVLLHEFDDRLDDCLYEPEHRLPVLPELVDS